MRARVRQSDARFAGVAQHDAAARGHARAISRVARYGQVDTAAGFLEMTLDEREIGLLHFALTKWTRQVSRARRRFSRPE